MKTIAQQLNVKQFPFEIKDKNGKVIYYEDSYGYWCKNCLLYTSPSPRDRTRSRMPSSA